MLHKKNVKTGFTLVELLAVIVILAIILVIAVPKIMDVINSSKKSTLETSVKMIASSAEKTKMQNAVLGKEDATITCDSVAKLSNSDYESCTIEFDGNTAKVTVKGKGKFEGLNVCGGTKNSATAQKEECATDGMYFTYEKLFDEDDVIPFVEVKDVSKCTAYLNEKACASSPDNEKASCEESVETVCLGGNINGVTITTVVIYNEIPSTDYEEAGLYVSTEPANISITGYNIKGGLDVVIPSIIDGYTVVEIGKNAFYDDRHYTGLGIKSVVIPNAVTTIVEGAFYDNELTNVVIPSSVTSIGEHAFSGNPISKVKLANPNIEIGNCAFGEKENISTHNIPDTYECEAPPS